MRSVYRLHGLSGPAPSGKAGINAGPTSVLRSAEQDLASIPPSARFLLFVVPAMTA